jgi:hypothetical protein
MYTVAEVTIPTAGVFFTARNDDRTPKEVVYDGMIGWRTGAESKIYESLDKVQFCVVQNIFTGLTKAEAEAKKKTLIEYARIKGTPVLNVK